MSEPKFTFQLRVSAERRDLIKRTSSERDTTMTEFLLSSAEILACIPPDLLAKYDEIAKTHKRKIGDVIKSGLVMALTSAETRTK